MASCNSDAEVIEDREGVGIGVRPETCPGNSQTDRERHQPLLCTIVQVALHAAALGVRCLDDPHAGCPHLRQAVLQRLLGALALGDVLARADHADDLAAGHQHLAAAFDPSHAGAHVSQPMLDRERGAGPEGPADRGAHPPAVVGVDQAEVRVEVDVVTLRLESIEPVLLIREPDGVGGSLPGPRSDMGERLRVIELTPALGKIVERHPPAAGADAHVATPSTARRASPQSSDLGMKPRAPHPSTASP